LSSHGEIWEGVLLICMAAVLSGCTPLADPRVALVCTVADGRGFKVLLDYTHDYATFRPIDDATVSILKIEEMGATSTLRNGAGITIVVDRQSGTATVRSGPLAQTGTFTCHPDPSPPREIPDLRRRV
jgi:hypothetical protein